MASDNKIHKDNISETAIGINTNSGSHDLKNLDLVDGLWLENGLLFDTSPLKSDGTPLTLTDMETYIMALIKKSSDKRLLPETAFAELFNSLTDSILQNTHYITLLFDEQLMATNKKVKEALIRISDVAEGHLVRFIESGKNGGVFINGQPSKPLAASIMKSFRSTMKDEYCIKIMLLKLKSPETLIN